MRPSECSIPSHRQRTLTGSRRSTWVDGAESAGARRVHAVGVIELLVRERIPIAGRQGRGDRPQRDRREADGIAAPAPGRDRHHRALEDAGIGRGQPPGGHPDRRRRPAGARHKDFVKPGATVIDVGMNRVTDARTSRSACFPRVTRGLPCSARRDRPRRRRPPGGRRGRRRHDAGAGRCRPAHHHDADDEHASRRLGARRDVMRRVALTGGIATGKSRVRAQFEKLGVPTIDADTLARDAVAGRHAGLAAVIDRFGRGVLTPSGTLDRHKLASIVFMDSAARRDLEAIVHPAVQQATDAWFDSLDPARYSVAVADIPLLYEVGRDRDFDAVIVTAVDPETQVRRVIERDGASEAEARQRLAAQLPIAEKISRGGLRHPHRRHVRADQRAGAARARPAPGRCCASASISAAPRSKASRSTAAARSRALASTTPRGDYAATLEAIAGVVSRARAIARAHAATRRRRHSRARSRRHRPRQERQFRLADRHGRSLDDLERRLDRDVRIANDANCFAVSEAADGAAAGADGRVRRHHRHRHRRRGSSYVGRCWPAPTPSRASGATTRCPGRTTTSGPGRRVTAAGAAASRRFSQGPGWPRDSSRAAPASDCTPPDIVAARGRAATRRAEATLRALRAPAGARARQRHQRPRSRRHRPRRRHVEHRRGCTTNVPRLWGDHRLRVRRDPLEPDTVIRDTRLVRARRHGDSSGVRGAAWLWPVRSHVSRTFTLGPIQLSLASGVGPGAAPLLGRRPSLAT